MTCQKSTNQMKGLTALFTKKRSGTISPGNGPPEDGDTSPNLLSPRRGTVLQTPQTPNKQNSEELSITVPPLTLTSPKGPTKKDQDVVQSLSVPNSARSKRSSTFAVTTNPKEMQRVDSLGERKDVQSNEYLHFKQYFNETIPSNDVIQEGISLPVYILDSQVTISKKARIKLIFLIPKEFKGWGTQLVLNANVKCSELYQLIFDAFKKRESKSSLQASDLLVKAKGINEYIYGSDVALIDFEYIRNCIEQDTLIELSVNTIQNCLPPGKEIQPCSGSREKDFTYHVKKMIGDDLIGFSNPDQDCISSWELTKKPLRVQVKNLILNGNQISEGAIVFCVCKLAYGKILLAEPQVTSFLDKNGNFNSLIVFNDVQISDVPKEAHILFELMGSTKETLTNNTFEKSQSLGKTLGWSRIFLFDQKNEFRTGSNTMRLWSGEPNYSIISSSQNPSNNALVVNMEFDPYVLPVVFPDGKKRHQRRVPMLQLDNIIKQDCLREMTEKEKLLVWNYREHMCDLPHSLPKVLRSCDWTEYGHVYEVHRLLKEWKQFEDPKLALELLDVDIQDRTVREYAITILDRLSDVDIANTMLQLVEICKFESFHFSPFISWLLKRALKSPHIIGFRMFWSLKSQLDDDLIKERFQLIIDEYLRVCDKEHKKELDIQVEVVNELLKVASSIAAQPRNTKSEDLNLALVKLLKDLKLPNRFSTPINIKVQCTGINIDKCRVMSSKKRPLMLNFKNADDAGDDVIIFFKAGDDLRQDELTLQMLKIMDSLWKKKGLDLHINAYGCVSTSKNCGIIECVPNSKTIAKLSDKLNDTISQETILNWVKKESRTQEMIEQAIDNFKASCAGYLVATHVLGVGDRHNDNIMLTNKGNLFHIDFGHFLGNKKSVDLKIAQVERETGPFVFTKAYAHVLGGPESSKFRELQDLTGKAFNILRENGNLLMVLFKLMIHSGFPELEKAKDIEWIREKLVLDLSEEEAGEHFCGLFIESMSNKRQLVMDAVHYWKHHYK